jgi:2-keto-3-deoxy-L-rhamnonate aldolase RhmA
MGIPAQFRHEDFIAAGRRIASAAHAHGKIAGILATDQAWAKEYWGYGYRMIAYGLDHMLFQAALSAGLRGLRGLMETTPIAPRDKTNGVVRASTA